MPLLEIDCVTVRFGATRAVDRVSARIEAGEIVGLIGPNGAGKTSLVRAVAGLASHDGTVRIEGRDNRLMDRRARARAVSYLPQGHVAHWPLEASRLVALGRLPHLTAMQSPSDADNEAIEDAMRRCDALGFRGRSVTTLSSGERARVMLARALAVESRILLADEPVAALDPYHQLQIMETLGDYAAQGAVVLAVLHDLTLAERFCTRLLLMTEGRLLIDGPPDAVLTDEHVAHAYHVTVLRAHGNGTDYVVPFQRIAPEGGST